MSDTENTPSATTAAPSPAAAAHQPLAGVESLQERLGYHFGNRAILLQALTHKSFGHEFFQDKPISARDNERLEFLGDAILDGVVSDILLETYPGANEGQLSKIRASVVNEKTLAVIARRLGLAECLRLGRGEQQTRGHEKDSILSSAFEAIIAAIFIDGGFNAVYPVVRHLFAPLFRPELARGESAMSATSTETEEPPHFQDYKTRLQEKLQARHRITPGYQLVSSRGPDHEKTFVVEVRMNGLVLAEAQGQSKKQAEQNAARAALDRLQKDALPDGFASPASPARNSPAQKPGRQKPKNPDREMGPTA